MSTFKIGQEVLIDGRYPHMAFNGQYGVVESVDVGYLGICVRIGHVSCPFNPYELKIVRDALCPLCKGSRLVEDADGFGTDCPECG